VQNAIGFYVALGLTFAHILPRLPQPVFAGPRQEITWQKEYYYKMEFSV